MASTIPRNVLAYRKNPSLRNTLVLSTLLAILGTGIALQYNKAITAETLSDINPFSYEGIAALYLQRNGIIEGFPDGTFRGYLPVNRAQAAKVLLLAAEFDILDLENKGLFPDVEKDAWYEKYAINATKYGLMQGYPDGTFGPSFTVNRAEFLKMISNAFELEQGVTHTYKDVPPEEWFARYAGIAQQYNLFLYDQDRLFPGGLMTRDEVVWAIYQILIFKELGTVVATPFDSVTPFPPGSNELITIEDLRSAAPENTGSSSGSGDGSGSEDTNAESFIDIDPLTYEGIAVLYLLRNGIIDNIPGGLFRGYSNINRMQGVRMLLLAGGYEILNLQNKGIYSDVEEGSWYEVYAMNATKYGILKGYPDGTLKPLEDIRRSEFMKMLTDTFGLEKNIPYTYIDVPTDAWFASYVGIAEKYNLFLYDQNQLVPEQSMTRYETAWALYQILTYKELGTVVATPFDHVPPYPSETAELITIEGLHPAPPPGSSSGGPSGSGSGGPSGSGSGGPSGSGSGGPSGSGSGGPSGSGSGGSGSGGPSGSGSGGPSGSGSGGSGSGSGGSSSGPNLGVCGNGILEQGEQCDDGNTNNNDNCTSTCRLPGCGDGLINRNTEECDDGNFSNNDLCLNNCVINRCGDSILNPVLEECDDGDLDNTDNCLTICRWARCGDGYLFPTEECDDGDQEDYDECVVGNDCHWAYCGDGFHYRGFDPNFQSEECDDGNPSNNDFCLVGCVLNVCGDGWLYDGVEICEDGNLIYGDGCDHFCLDEVCGNGFSQPYLGEECDDGNAVNDDFCTDSCSRAICGDGVLQTIIGEQCDDGNVTYGDGCDHFCLNEICGNGIHQPHLGEQCDDGNAVDDDGCTNSCQFPICGDNILQPWEDCDNGDTINGDGCDESCIFEVCGNGYHQPHLGEQCDDGNSQNTNDGCRNNCQIPRCGDGIVETGNGEQCDDGNTAFGDGCDQFCLNEICGNGFHQPYVGEECDDGNSDNFDGCRNNCQYPRCGDGIIDSQFGEECDDGNTIFGDGCHWQCLNEDCFDNDGGIDGFVFGTTSTNESSQSDFCRDGANVEEFFCHERTFIASGPFFCNNGCFNGVCNP